ncbi:integral membrane protein [Streptomyces sp. e14]|uniref:hypothetical protein n=1 Tax=Streptomyces sp. e14 TaxID=645465 RepID=UPI0001D06DE4|nr:hypothetical protein [Streptomyces sp. e14]EFF91350.1 integral membrane protein [Streptomyces sp. e14]
MGRLPLDHPVRALRRRRDGPRPALPADPGYGAYTVTPGYPDLFLPDEDRREHAAQRYYRPGTPPGVRRDILRAYAVRWVLDDSTPHPVPGLRPVARDAAGDEVLYAVAP